MAMAMDAKRLRSAIGPARCALGVAAGLFICGASADPAQAQGADAAATTAPGQALCGDERLQGRSHPPIVEPVSDVDPRQCGGGDLVEISHAAGVQIAPPAVLTCAMARATADWVATGAEPAAATHLGAPLARMRQVSAYACRTRGRAAGGRLSEHARANALDISAFVLADDRTITVLDDWGPAQETAANGAFLRAVWQSACGPFATVLGPEADAAHRDHFHFDAAHRRSPFCQ